MSERWNPLRFHREQTRLWKENKRFSVVAAGRRSGKTELAKRRLISLLALKKNWPDARYFAAAPTRDQAKRIFWKDLKAMMPKGWVKRIYESELAIVTRFGSEIWVAGLDKPQRLDGTPWDGGVLDEFADMKPGAWAENIRPALSDRAGWCWLIGVPEGFNHFKDIADYAASGIDPDWGFYTWRSEEILDSVEIESARRHLDERTFRQEYEARFEGASGRVYYAYSEKLHQDASADAAEGLPILVCCDFNVDPCAWVLVQTDGEKVWAFDEIVLRNTSTQEMARELLRRYGGRKNKLIVYGDAAGSARSTAGASDYAILMDMGLKEQRIKRSNPQVRDRVNAVNSMLRNAAGEARLFHHPRCLTLKRDFERVVWRQAAGEIDRTNRELTHASDALGYFVEREFPLRMRRPADARRFYK
ncbi:MAG: hypothetical protein NUW09_09220 [Deltaproteobacteria bacterium]|nr:hypothetical protein [Deltaproteobacteria bacterium]